MKTSIIVAVTVLFGVTGIVAKAPHPGAPGTGRDILHFFVRKAMSPVGTNANATGFVDARQNRQGHANNQNLTITAANLNADTPFKLFARLGDDAELTLVTEFTTDSSGAVAFNYGKVDASKGKSLGKGKTPLPDVLDPISNIRELAIGNTSTQIVLVSTQIVLRADLTAPDKLQYLIQRNLTNDGVEPFSGGAIRIKATEKKVQFRLLAGCLNVNTDYLLALNGQVVSTHTTDDKGNLKIHDLPAGVPDVLDIHQVAVWNTFSNSVLSISLP